METIVGYVLCCGVGIMFSLFNLQSYVTQPAIKNKELSFCAAFPLGMRPTSSNLDRTSLANKGFIKAKRYVFSGRTNTGIPSRLSGWPSCQLGQPIRKQDSPCLVCLRIKLYNKAEV